MFTQLCPHQGAHSLPWSPRYGFWAARRGCYSFLNVLGTWPLCPPHHRGHIQFHEFPGEADVTSCLLWDGTLPKWALLSPLLHPHGPTTMSNDMSFEKLQEALWASRKTTMWILQNHWSSVTDFGISTWWPFLKLTEDSVIFPFLLPEPELAMCHSVAVIHRKFLFTTPPLPTGWEFLTSGTKLCS